MISDFLQTGTPFDGCTASYGEAETVLVGAPYDGTSSFRAGSRFAPTAIRANTRLSQETWSPYQQRDLTDASIHDAGNIELPPGSKEAALSRIEAVVTQIVSDGKRPFIFGGEHLVTLPIVSALLSFYPNLSILQLDAHLDLMDELFGDSLSHGTVMRRCFEKLCGGTLTQVGIRSGSRDEYDFAATHTTLFPYEIPAATKLLPILTNTPVYLTLDLDVFDPSLLPGTGTPEVGGIFFQAFSSFVDVLREVNIVGCDVVELAPDLDPSGASTIIASKIARELLLAL